MNRTALLISAVITAFVLVLTGGIVARMASAPTDAAQDQAVSQPVQAAVEAAVPAAEQNVVEAAAPAVVNEIDAQTAARLALAYAPGAKLLGWPELVDLQGARAYEVVLDQGTIYIDAATGTVLYDGRPTITPMQAGHTEDEHEAHEQHEANEQEHDDD